MPNSHRPGMHGDLQLRDCRIWAEIDYLDSPTDYRDCLPGAQPPPMAADRSDLVMLDPHKLPRNHIQSSRLLFAGLIFTLINLLVLGYILYQLFEAF